MVHGKPAILRGRSTESIKRRVKKKNLITKSFPIKTKFCVFFFNYQIRTKRQEFFLKSPQRITQKPPKKLLNFSSNFCQND